MLFIHSWNSDKNKMTSFVCKSCFVATLNQNIDPVLIRQTYIYDKLSSITCLINNFNYDNVIIIFIINLMASSRRKQDKKINYRRWRETSGRICGWNKADDKIFMPPNEYKSSRWLRKNHLLEKSSIKIVIGRIGRIGRPPIDGHVSRNSKCPTKFHLPPRKIWFFFQKYLKILL